MREKQAINCFGNERLKGVKNPASLGTCLQTSITVAWETKTIKFSSHPEDLAKSSKKDSLWGQETWVKIKVLYSIIT